MPAGRHIKAFLDMIAAERGAAANTIEAYRRDLEDYAAFLRKDLAGASADDVRAYLADLSDRGFAPSSASRRLSAIRQFHRFLYLDGLAASDPTAAIGAARRGRPLPKVLGTEAVDALLAEARRLAEDPAQSPARAVASARLLALVEVLYATGLRVSELIALPAGAARHGTELITVRGKGGRERMVPIGGPARDAIALYRSRLGEAERGSRWLFPAGGESGHLTRQQVGRDLKRLAGAAGVPVRTVSPHVMRHAFASHLLQHGADLRSVQELLGHADISTTQIYTHVLDARLAAMVRDLHPLADAD